MSGLRQQSLWEATATGLKPPRNPRHDPKPGDTLACQLLDERGALLPYTLRVLEVIRSYKGPRVRIALLDRQLCETTEILTARVWWESMGLTVPELIWQDAGEGWTLFAEGRSAFVRNMGEAAEFLWGAP